jgi:CubicO group peptidase (beta-lactamase class C family)
LASVETLVIPDVSDEGHDPVLGTGRSVIMTRLAGLAAVLSLAFPAVVVAQSDSVLAARIDSALRSLQARGFSGVVRVDRNGTTLIEKGYGLANRAANMPFTPATVVQIGSNTKDFTLVALLQLHERGRLSIRDSLHKFFPSAPPDKRNITLWQLANHVAGFPIGLGGDFDRVTRREFIEMAMQRQLLFEPGAGEQYSNTGFSLLAAVIELVSGQTYDEFVRDNILVPIGLKNTGFLLPRFDPGRVAHGYRNGEDMGAILSKPHADDGPYWNLRGNGGMLSTVADMAAFYRSLLETNRLLKPETRALRFDPGEPLGLAGSDLVSAFLYDRFPPARTEIIIATNTAEMRERPVRAVIGAVLGLPSPDGGPRAAQAPRRNATPPPAPVASMLRAFVAAVNASDADKLRAFINEHFIIAPGSPDASARAERLGAMRRNVGALELIGLDQVEPLVVEIAATSAIEGAVTFRVQLTPQGRIAGVQVMVGG